MTRTLRVRGAGDTPREEREEEEATGTTDPEPPTGVSTFALFGLDEQQMGQGGGRMPALPSGMAIF